jgi:hypothetical protein
MIEVYQYDDGPSLYVEGNNFRPMEDDQTKLWGKTETVWTWIKTSALGLLECPSGRAFHRYVSDCVPYSLRHTTHAGVLQAMRNADSSGLLGDAARLWTAIHFLLRGWQAKGMVYISDPRRQRAGGQPLQGYCAGGEYP